MSSLTSVSGSRMNSCPHVINEDGALGTHGGISNANIAGSRPDASGRESRGG